MIRMMMLSTLGEPGLRLRLPLSIEVEEREGAGACAASMELDLWGDDDDDKGALTELQKEIVERYRFLSHKGYANLGPDMQRQLTQLREIIEEVPV